MPNVHSFTIKKGNGGTRRVFAPSHHHRKVCRSLLPELEMASILLDKHDVAHGFRHGRNAVTNAMPHVGYNWTISFDLDSCFDRITYRMSKPFMPALFQSFKDYLFVAWRTEWIAVQGLPTSPVICNIVLSELDNTILDIFGHHDMAYTRYADDITISGNNEYLLSRLKSYVPLKAKDYGFPVNRSKTKIQMAKAGRRIVTGVAVDDKGVHPTRKMKRKLRAAAHQANWKKVRGYKGWIACRQPDVLRWAMAAFWRGKEWSELASLVSKREMERMASPTLGEPVSPSDSPGDMS